MRGDNMHSRISALHISTYCMYISKVKLTDEIGCSPNLGIYKLHIDDFTISPAQRVQCVCQYFH